MSPIKKYLFALIFLVVGIVLGIQLAGWITPKKHKAPAAKHWTRPAILGGPSAAKNDTSAPKKNPVQTDRSKPATASKPTPRQEAVSPPASVPTLPPAVVRKTGHLAAGPKVVIVLDDWGYNLQALGTALAIKEPLTLAVLPHLTYSTQVAQKAHAAGHEIMLHMPMQPLNDVPLEKGTIMSGMNAGEVRQLLDAAITNVPHIRGVNNHMGSKITQDPRILKIVMTDLQSRGLFFLNSMVTGSTVGREVAAELPVMYAERDIFLDNVRTEAAVLAELERLKRIAIRNGTAIGIGHDEPVTLKAIQKVLPSWHAEGIRLVRLSEIISPDADSV